MHIDLSTPIQINLETSTVGHFRADVSCQMCRKNDLTFSVVKIAEVLNMMYVGVISVTTFDDGSHVTRCARMKLYVGTRELTRSSSY